MKKVLFKSLVLALGVALVSSAAYAKKSDSGVGNYSRYAKTSDWNSVMSGDNPAAVNNHGGLNSSAAATTVVLNSSKFDSGASCVANSWTTVDITAQTVNGWHVDDFTTAPWAGTVTEGGQTLSPVQGSKSMWMAALPPAPLPVDPILCGYQTLPGYGNTWNQSFCTKNCLSIAGGADATKLDVAFVLKFDSEPSYDGTFLEYTADCTGASGWKKIGGPLPAGWSAGGIIHFAQSITVIGNPVKVRFHFQADGAWSNQDGLYSGMGCAIDSLKVENLALEDFEAAGIGVSSVTDWQSCNEPGYGNFLALFKKATGAGYEDLCLDNLGCYWAAISGSTEFYTCGTPAFPAQKIVPHINTRGQYMSNEIWSPTMSLLGSSGTEFHLRYTVYSDLPLDNLIFHIWHVRTIDNTGCPSSWQDRNFVYYGEDKAWVIFDNQIGTKINVLTGDAIQVAIGVIDQCLFWCPNAANVGTGACHSPAPYIDTVKVTRVNVIGPQWDVRDLETFQDNFSANGTVVGTARFDSARDVMPPNSFLFVPGDSATVLFLLDPTYATGFDGTAATINTASGLLNDPTLSTFVGRHKTKNQVYAYFTVTPTQPAKVGAGLSEGPGGTANRFPYAGAYVDHNGKTWGKLRMDYAYAGNATNLGDGHAGTTFQANKFVIDVNDALFTPGDTITYFYSATSNDGTTYFSTSWGSTTNPDEVVDNPMEVTILPAGGHNRGGDILYVDGADGTGVQNYYDGAFLTLGLANKIDRYDVRAASSGVSNRLSSRVVSVANQLNAIYAKIIWDCGTNSTTLGDGSKNPEKNDDYKMLNLFLAGLNTVGAGGKGDGGVMLLGDRVVERLDSYSGLEANAFRSTYIPFTLTSADHRIAPGVSVISPAMRAWPARAYTDDFNLFGGCPGLNNFDVIDASAPSRLEMTYKTPSNAPNGGVISNQTVNANGRTATVIMTGFSFAFVRDDELDGISDRAKFMRDSIVYMGNPLGQVTGAGPALKNSLSQNYPNPFNPQTSIAFTIKDRGAVTLKVYNVNGELVRTLINENRAAGSYTKVWDGHNDAGTSVSSGVYFYKLVTNNFSQTKKMVLLK